MAKKRDMLTRFRSSWKLELNRLSSGSSAMRVTRKNVTDHMTAAGFVTPNGEPVWDSSKISKFLAGKVGVTLDECVALAGALGTSVDDLLSLDSSVATLQQRVENEWQRIIVSLQEINNREFDILTAKSSLVRALDALDQKGELKRVPNDFERLWQLVEFYLGQTVTTKYNGERALHLSEEERLQGLFKAIKIAHSEKHMEEARESFMELGMHVYVSELVAAREREIKRFELEKVIAGRTATVAEKAEAERSLRQSASADLAAAKVLVERYRNGDEVLR